MLKENAQSLRGFAWYVHRRPAFESPGPDECPFDGADTTYMPLHLPIGTRETGIRNRGRDPAFLAITPALTFGPPEVGWKWQVEPAELDGFRTEDGRVRLVAMQRRQTPWGIVAECDLEGESLPPCSGNHPSREEPANV
jgi:hypothetical protein